jgi:hypothetical protein
MCFRYTTIDQMDSDHLYPIIAFEAIFLIHIGLSFLVDFKNEGSS